MLVVVTTCFAFDVLIGLRVFVGGFLAGLREVLLLGFDLVFGFLYWFGLTCSFGWDALLLNSAFVLLVSGWFACLWV